jgi:hypothetical protein
MPNDLKEKLTHDEVKQATKEAIKEWMDEKFALLGLWSLRTILVAALGALTYFILATSGWHK